MAISRALDNELNEALHQLEEEAKANVVYIVDSFGALYQESIEFLVKKFKSILRSKEIGIHAHNNQQLAFGNTIEAIIHDANFVDGTIYGLGRAAGNCPLELLIGFLKNPKFDIRPILDLISNEFIPLRDKIEWGYIIPYAITGILDEHPKAAMALRNSEKRENYREFYESLVGDDLD
jgi:4-hydroxy 2-oxovalerate aldolase